MPRLIHLNGPTGVGKSTLAARCATDHPKTLNLDADEIVRHGERDSSPRWQRPRVRTTSSSCCSPRPRPAYLTPATTIIDAAGDAGQTYRTLIAELD